MQELNYHHLRYFQVVAHEGHLSRAAERLHVSQSALSTQIRQLEARLGQALFERRGRALHLTEAGRIALDHADAIFATGHELLSTLRQAGDTVRPLRVGAIATLSRNFQLAFLRPVLGRDDVEVHLVSGSAGELLQALAALNLDVVLTNQPPPHDSGGDLAVRELDGQPVGLIGLPGEPVAEGDLRTSIEQAPLVLPARSSGVRMAFDALVTRLGASPRIAAEVDDMAMLRLLAREGVGRAVIPPIVVTDELDNGLLVEIQRLPGIVEHFYAVTIRRRFPNPILATLFGPVRVGPE